MLTIFSCLFYINNDFLEWVHEYKYFGVLVSDDLKWDIHIESICAPAGRKIGVIYWNLYHQSDPSFLLTFFLSAS